MATIRGPFGLGGHLGPAVSALVDDQLDAESTERAWAHVETCAACRRLVEHEGSLKRRLAQFADPEASRQASPSSIPDGLLGSLLDLDPAALAWAETDELERRGRGRRVGLALVGAGSVSAAVLGLTTLGAAPLDIGRVGSPASGTPSSAGSGAGVLRGPVDGFGRTAPAGPPAAAATVLAPVVTLHSRHRVWDGSPGGGRATGTNR